MSKSCYLDFEFNRVTHEKVNLVCACIYDDDGKCFKFWLHNDEEAKQRLRKFLKNYSLVIGYSAVAECRSYYSLGLNPLSFEWIDLFLEYRMMTNHNDNLLYGKQLVDGKVKTVRKPKPKWERSEGDEAGFKPTHSLAEATYKLTGQIRDTEEKTAMRNLIISDPKEFTAKQKEAILRYCLHDAKFLPQIWEKLQEEFISLIRPSKENIERELRQYVEEAKVRGRYSAHTAIMESRGYPIDVEETRNFSKQVGNILYETQHEINELFPDIRPFRWKKSEGRYTWNQVATREWIKENHDTERWMMTDGGKKKNPQLSLSLEAFERFYDYKHDYPLDNFGAQMVRYLKLKQNLYGFNASPGGKRKNFWDSVGPDGRVRPYMNHYGAQSSRSQPAASGFMFLKPAWMRALVQPKQGMFMAGIDYGSEEFFLQALESKDMNMIEAYLSGDPYWYQAVQARAVRKTDKKEDNKAIRDRFKATTLGIGYLMTKVGLAIKLTLDTGQEWTEDEAQAEIDDFYDRFSDLKDFQDEIQEEYSGGGSFIRLKCGWYMWGDNDNIRSVCNVPIQGAGASIMRKAVDLAVSRGIYIPFTLHDALYMEDLVGNERKIEVLRDCMREAFVDYVDDDMKKYAEKIRLDPFAWSPNYKPNSTLYVGKSKWEVPCSNLYIDERAMYDYQKFSKYFTSREEDTL